MATTGTFTFNPALAEVVLNAFGRIQIRRTELLAEHLNDAATEANLLLTEWANRQVNLWTSTAYVLSVAQGVATYTLPTNMVTILIATLTITDNAGNVQDRVVTPVSTTEYASYSNKAVQAPPTVFWLDRQIVPKLTLWPVPDIAYTLKIQYVRQVQDAAIAGGTTLEVPYRWIDAFTAGLAARLAQIYRPAAVQYLDGKYERAWSLASNQDTEDVPMYVTPCLGDYYR